MSDRSGAAGLAALSLCESLLLALTENGIIGLADAAAAHRAAAPLADGSAGAHAKATALLEAIRVDGIAVQPAAPATNDDGNPRAT